MKPKSTGIKSSHFVYVFSSLALLCFQIHTAHACLQITRQFDRENKHIQYTSLQVNSPSLKKLLKDVIGSFPGQSFYTKNISINFEPKCLYHYRHELAAASKTFEPGSEGARHAPILTSFINEHFKDTIAETENLLEQKMINFPHLWTIFKPGVLVYYVNRGQRRVYELNSYQYGTQCNTFGLILSVTLGE